MINNKDLLQYTRDDTSSARKQPRITMRWLVEWLPVCRCLTLAARSSWDMYDVPPS